MNHLYVDPIIFKYPWFLPCCILSLIFGAGPLIIPAMRSKMKIYMKLSMFAALTCVLTVVQDQIPDNLFITDFFDDYFPLRGGLIAYIVLSIIGIIRSYTRKEFKELTDNEQREFLISIFIISLVISVFIGSGILVIQKGALIIGIFIIALPLFLFFGFLFSSTSNLTINGEVVYKTELPKNEEFSKLYDISCKDIYFDEQNNYFVIETYDKYIEKTFWTKEIMDKYNFSIMDMNSDLKEKFAAVINENPDVINKYQGIRIEYIDLENKEQ